MVQSPLKADETGVMMYNHYITKEDLIATIILYNLKV